MGILSWLPGLKPSTPTPADTIADSAPGHLSPPPSPSSRPDCLSHIDIVVEFERLQQQNASLVHNNALLADQLRQSQHLNSTQQKQLSAHQLQTKNANSELQVLKQRLRDSQARSKAQAAAVANLQHVVAQRNAELKVIEKNRDHSLALLKNKLKATNLEYDMLVAHEEQLRNRVQDAQLQLEYLNCTTTHQTADDLFTERRDGPLVAEPFVVALIDGDAYGWSSDIFDSAYGRSPGEMAAHRLHTTVIEYMRMNNRVPVTANIIVKVFVNECGKYSGTDRRGYANSMEKRIRASFRTDFNGAMPLFDYIDVGQGKERTDDKIHQNFRIFLPNPLCHAVFLAACTDNGFARMLQPFRNNATARDKIRLVSCNEIAKEIAALGFETLVWPAVFATRSDKSPVNMARAAEEKKNKAWEMHNKTVGHTGVKDEMAKAMVLDATIAVGAVWDVSGMISEAGRNVGLRRKIERPPSGCVIGKLDDKLEEGVD